ncbi:MAG TPA: 3-isopropylmalate dehydratase small subunit [Acetobacteraceae bacterium]|nr:3-isopropylmalate dehydratase small subunit [Acetobacteraceae bacterium]
MMQPFTTVDAKAVALDMPNVDTDQIIPARFLWHARADGYGHLLFHDLRQDAEGAPKPGFVLDAPAGQGAAVLVADRNFGCGSSREHAVWALVDAGIRVVIAPSFGDIFYSNSFKNGLLPIVLPEARCTELRAALARNPGARLVVDLAAQTVSGPVGVNDGFATDSFSIDPMRKELLLAGEDEIGFTQRQSAAIAAFERDYTAAMPWL